jgi:hypothetical protein
MNTAPIGIGGVGIIVSSNGKEQQQQGIMCSDLPRDLGVLLLNSDSISDAALAAPVLASADDESARRWGGVDLKGEESRKGRASK